MVHDTSNKESEQDRLEGSMFDSRTIQEVKTPFLKKALVRNIKANLIIIVVLAVVGLWGLLMHNYGLDREVDMVFMVVAAFGILRIYNAVVANTSVTMKLINRLEKSSIAEQRLSKDSIRASEKFTSSVKESSKSLAQVATVLKSVIRK